MHYALWGSVITFPLHMTLLEFQGGRVGCWPGKVVGGVSGGTLLL